MTEYMACPVCGQNDWQVMAKRDFLKSDTDKLGGYHPGVYRFMFNDWLPGHEVIGFENLFCRACGLISFFPRPTVEDLNRLRQSSAEETTGCLARTDLAIADRRSKIMYESINRYYSMAQADRVLDYGGGDGSLMQHFLNQGKTCEVIDYSTVIMEGITKAGNTVYDLADETTYDVIVCNHVIEHIADPRGTLTRLLNHLTDTGVLFVEVPMELWKVAPLLKLPNPVTHINFFSPASLHNTFTLAGASVLKCELTEYLHTNGNWNPGLRCIGRKAQSGSSRPLRKPDGMDYLNPGWGSYLRYYRGNRRKLKAELARRFKGRNG